jgi:CRP-like cAMP-binding protein
MNDPINLHPERNRLIRKLESIAVLSDADRQAIFNLPMTIKSIEPDQDIVRDGDRPTECCLIVEGFACRYKLTAEGRRQIMSFHIPGDIPDLQSLFLRVMDHSLATLVPSRVGFISHDDIYDVLARQPTLAALLWRDTLIDAGVFRQWMIGIGRRSAYGRIAHLLCELLVRYRAVELTVDHKFELPITQTELGDALGLSTVHVNRSLQEMRADGLIRSEGRTLVVEDWEGLKKAGEFDATYLHLDKKWAVA